MKRLAFGFFLVILSFFITACDPSKPLFIIGPPKTHTPPKTKDEPKTQEIKGNIFDLINMATTIKCTYSDYGDSFSTNGTAYVNGRDVRIENITEIKGEEPYTVYSITYNDETHFWYSDREGGIIFNLLDLAEGLGTQNIQIEISENSTESESSSEGQQNPNKNNNKTNVELEKQKNLYVQEFTFICNPWTVDKTLYIPPEDIDFYDTTELTERILFKLKGQCQLCEDLPTQEAKDACLYALECQ